MQLEYRIKEVKVGLPGNTSTYFYPQVLLYRKPVTSRWVCIIMGWKNNNWNIFYQFPTGKINTVPETGLSLVDKISKHIIACKSLKEAQVWIKKYKEQEAENIGALQEEVVKYVGSRLPPRTIHPAE